MPKKRVAILGASGIVGQRFCQLLSDHPFFELPDLFSSQRSESRTLADLLKVPEETISGELLHRKMAALDPATVLGEHYDAIFSALPSSMELNVELELANSGSRILTNSGMNRMRPGVPIIVPEVNDSHFSLIEDKDGFIVANGNCSSIGLALPLKPLTEFGPVHVEVTTMQALSGAGYPGVPSMDLMSNLIPYIESEEHKIEAEVPKILGSPGKGEILSLSLKIDATCLRVPVRDGHTESVTVTFKEPVEQDEIARSLSGFAGTPQRLSLPTAPVKPIILETREDRPQPALDLMRGSPARAQGMPVVVGRLRVAGNQARFVTLSHNTIRGAAGGSVLNAEILYSRGMI